MFCEMMSDEYRAPTRFISNSVSQEVCHKSHQGPIKRVRNSVLLDFDGSSNSFNSMKAGSQMLNEKYQSFTIILDFCIASLA